MGEEPGQGPSPQDHENQSRGTAGASHDPVQEPIEVNNQPLVAKPKK